jgi:hypothetical protein
VGREKYNSISPVQGGKGEIQQHLSSTRWEGRNATAPLQYKGGKGEIQQNLSSYHTVTPPPDPLSSASLGQEGRNTSISPVQGEKGEIQQHLSTYDMVTPPPDPPRPCLSRTGREKYNSNSPVQQGGKGEKQQHLSSYNTLTSPLPF